VIAPPEPTGHEPDSIHPQGSWLAAAGSVATALPGAAGNSGLPKSGRRTLFFFEIRIDFFPEQA
jgi:hypothetical protein